MSDQHAHPDPSPTHRWPDDEQQLPSQTTGESAATSFWQRLGAIIKYIVRWIGAADLARRLPGP